MVRYMINGQGNELMGRLDRWTGGQMYVRLMMDS